MASTKAKPSPRTSRKRARARDELLTAARELVQRDGIGALTIGALAKAADVSKPAVYYYFASKDALITSLVLRLSMDEIGDLTAAIEGAPAGEPILPRFVRAYVAHHLDDLELFRVQYLWSQVVGIDPTLANDEVNPRMVALYGAVEARLAAEQRAGRLRADAHPRRLAVASWMAAHGLVSTLALLDSGGSGLLHGAKDLVDELCESLVRGAYV